MELISISIKGWRRFKNKVTLQTNGKLVAMLGANEAGKTSVLRALNFLDSDWEADNSDISRGGKVEDVEVVGYYFLGSEDREKAGLASPTRAVLTKRASGKGTFNLEPRPPLRDQTLRVDTKKQAMRAAAHQKFRESVDQEIIDALDSIISILSVDDEDLASEAVEAIKSLASRWPALELFRAPKFAQTLGVSLNELHGFEAQDNPWKRAMKAIQGTFPAILLFTQEHRDLERQYVIDSLLAEVPVAFENLASVAGLKIQVLAAAINAGSAAEIETIRTRANKNLRRKFQQFWRQSGVWPALAINGRTIDVLIENEGDQFTALAERSDGLRQFIALQAFAMRERKGKPILLIDEAETHLHYDAQADLIQMLYKQEVASKVIYTTHSAGCLPEDLGNGVRLVTPTPKALETSSIVNRFWGAKEPGFSPLLIGMGASTLAFFPTRKALMVEGETEMLLLPSMLREILGLDSLGFQIVPGLSKANKSQLPVNANGSSHIHYLVDGDEGGASLKKELLKNNVAENDIFMLASPDKSACQIEDFLDTPLLVSAVNQIIGKFNPGCELIDSSGIAETGKFASLENKFRVATGKALQKIDVAYEILEISGNSLEARMVNTNKQAAFGVLAKALMSKFFPNIEGQG